MSSIEETLNKMAEVFKKHRPEAGPPAWSCSYECEHIKFDPRTQGWLCMRTKVPTQLAMRMYAHNRQCRPVAICKIEENPA